MITDRLARTMTLGATLGPPGGGWRQQQLLLKGEIALLSTAALLAWLAAARAQEVPTQTQLHREDSVVKTVDIRSITTATNEFTTTLV